MPKNAVVIVSADADHTRYLVETLAGCEVQLFQDPAQALAAAVAAKPPVVIVDDDKFPSGEPLAFVAELRAAGVKASILLVLPHGQVERPRQAELQFDILDKPVKADGLTDWMTLAVMQARMRR
ncbi:MAG: hypothetical protein HY903_23225 [Deltaproteobacteria bacterium]|nr:hypothetical protein [Deltaproteobacteria bacterium]